MKKIWAVMVVVFLIAVLCGCDFREADRQFIAASIGFDYENEKLILSTETLIINSESTDQQIETDIFSAQGESPQECMYNLENILSKRLMLSHCGVVAVGDSVPEKHFAQIIDFCRSEAINFSVYFVSAAKASELLSIKAKGALALGYELMSMLENRSIKTGIMYGSRLYEIEDARTKYTPAFMLPRFETAEENYKMNGSNIYLDCKPVLALGEKETIIYSIIRNANKGGTLEFDGQIYTVSSPYTRFKAELVDQTVNIALDIRIADNKSSGILCERVEETAAALVNKSEGDIFGFADRIYAKYPKLWKKIKNNKEELLSQASTLVTCEIRSRENES